MEKSSGFPIPNFKALWTGISNMNNKKWSTDLQYILILKKLTKILSFNVFCITIWSSVLPTSVPKETKAYLLRHLSSFGVFLKTTKR